jgi:hypothetical protein
VDELNEIRFNVDLDDKLDGSERGLAIGYIPGEIEFSRYHGHIQSRR